MKNPLSSLPDQIPPAPVEMVMSPYYDQPFTLLKFPVWMAMSNSLMPILLAVAVHSLRDILKGSRALLIVPLVPMTTGTAQIISGWPIWLALNSGQGYAATYPAALLTFGLSLTIVYLIGVKFCRQARAVPVTAGVGTVAHG